MTKDATKAVATKKTGVRKKACLRDKKKKSDPEMLPGSITRVQALEKFQNFSKKKTIVFLAIPQQCLLLWMRTNLSFF